MFLVLTIIFTALSVLVIYINMESWPARAIWLAVSLGSLFVLTGGKRALGPFTVVVVLSIYQSIKNSRMQDED